MCDRATFLSAVVADADAREINVNHNHTAIFKSGSGNTKCAFRTDIFGSRHFLSRRQFMSVLLSNHTNNNNPLGAPY
jgi:hypothetical protein